MASRKSRDTISALLGSPSMAPPPRPELVEERPRPLQSVEPVGEPMPAATKPTPSLRPRRASEPRTAPPEQPSAASVANAEGDDPDLDDTDLEAFDFQVDAPIVKKRRRKQVDYQTTRLNRATWQALHRSFMISRQQDVLLTFTEFSTLVVQAGLKALKEDRERGE